MDIKLDARSVMDQEVLRRVEALCTQEDPPACAAACPLHLDARAMNERIAAGDWQAAGKLYRKAVTFPRILSQICDAPCKSACRRGERGGAIELRELERALMERIDVPAKAPLFLPKKSKSAAIVGASLKGLAAALDLAKKGYAVTLYDRRERLGGSLWERDDLPAEALAADLKAVEVLPVRFEPGREVACATLEEAERFLAESGADALFFACESPLGAQADPETLQIGTLPILAGQRAGRGSEDSPVFDLFDGRSAAITLDRVLQGVSVRAGRDKEGAFTTRLYTDVQKVELAPPVRPAGAGYDEAEAVAEAGRCARCSCLVCVEGCDFLRRHGSYPRRYVREVYNNLSIAMGNHHANKMINTCALCGRCGAVCPNGLDLAGVFRAARERMVDTGKMPPSAHEFALLDMRYSLSDTAFFARPAPGGTRCDRVFFPGCQLTASEPGLVEAVYKDLNDRLPGGAGLMTGCCGIMAHWAGDQALVAETKTRLRDAWTALGSPEVIAACPMCATALRELIELPVRGIWDLLGEIGPPGEAYAPRRMLLHHACGARQGQDQTVRDAVKELAGAVSVELIAAEADGEAPCCGYGGLVPFAGAETANGMTERALELLGGADNQPLLTYCVNCRDRFLERGRESRHLLELVYTDVPCLRRPPGWSDRQENRRRLKQKLLAEIWGEKTVAEQAMELSIDDALAARLEADKILRDDLREAILHAEGTVERFVDPDSGTSTTSYRPGNVTFWVEYRREGSGYRVLNAYSHRMEFAFMDSDSRKEGGPDGRG